MTPVPIQPTRVVDGLIITGSAEVVVVLVAMKRRTESRERRKEEWQEESERSGNFSGMSMHLLSYSYRLSKNGNFGSTLRAFLDTQARYTCDTCTFPFFFPSFFFFFFFNLYVGVCLLGSDYNLHSSYKCGCYTVKADLKLDALSQIKPGGGSITLP
ncbi:hypothetical protein PanWU01x14_261130 [Parasponia andersonii]|uniref:Uncharacterized protein n=1 Tax=Parasponia andersonii TaxID=3476 RepID=A0A2P5B8R1_PARAD|nr:hypothetical protein PanWU01x14_261130 [Parasponia andersonii]